MSPFNGKRRINHLYVTKVEKTNCDCLSDEYEKLKDITNFCKKYTVSPDNKHEVMTLPFFVPTYLLEEVQL